MVINFFGIGIFLNAGKTFWDKRQEIKPKFQMSSAYTFWKNYLPIFAAILRQLRIIKVREYERQVYVL